MYALETQRSEEHTSELQSRLHLVCRLLLENKKTERGTLHAPPPAELTPPPSPRVGARRRVTSAWLRLRLCCHPARGNPGDSAFREGGPPPGAPHKPYTTLFRS